MREYAAVALKPVEIKSLLLSSSERKRQKDTGKNSLCSISQIRIRLVKVPKIVGAQTFRDGNCPTAFSMPCSADVNCRGVSLVEIPKQNLLKGE